ncbi:MAG TPA: tRNA lysidine(34) synthetase TilS [bacterium]|nr:tRNA lysidine(34) synthetase TilS [bacterium]
MADTILERVEAALHRRTLLRPGDRVVVATSGGADSVALLACLRDLAPRWALTLAVAHLDHGLRREAVIDARFIAALASAWHLPLYLESADAAGYARTHHLSIEAAARQVRYAFLGRAAQRWGAGVIAVGHTADDQVETLLLRLLRGGHPGGMWARRPRGGVVIIRPLLDLWRGELRAELIRRGLPWREDPSNQDLRHSRNSLRHDLIPALAGYMPDVQKRLKQTADALAVDDEALDALAAWAAHAVIAVAPEAVTMDRRRLLEQSEAIRWRLLRRAVGMAGGNIGRLRIVHLEEGVRLAEQGRPGQRLSLPGVVLEVREGGLLLQSLARLERPTGEHVVPERGRLEVAPFGLVMESELLTASEADVSDGATYLDADRVRPPLTLRAWRQGDRFRPLGMRGKKTVGDFLTDEKVPRLRRPRIPVLEDGDGAIVWVVGWRVAEDARITPETRRVLRLRAWWRAGDDSAEAVGVSPTPGGTKSLYSVGGGSSC